MNDLVDRLRGEYPVGPDGIYGKRSFADFIPPIGLEAAKRIEQLESINNDMYEALETSEKLLSILAFIPSTYVAMSRLYSALSYLYQIRNRRASWVYCAKHGNGLVISIRLAQFQYKWAYTYLQRWGWS